MPQQSRAVKAGVLTGLEELARLGRTLHKRRGDILAFFDHPGTSNGRTEAPNVRLTICWGTAPKSKASWLGQYGRHCGLDPTRTVAAACHWRPAPVGDGGGRLLSTSALLLWDVLARDYSHPGFDAINDEAFAGMGLARINEPSSKADTVRVLSEVGAPCSSLRTPSP